jgi:hypothetical protein
MAKVGTYNSTVSPNGPNGTMVVGGSTGAWTVTYADTVCTVDQAASSGDALNFSYTTGSQTLNFNGACPNSTYRGTCVAQQSHSNRVATGDDWTATATTGVPKAHATHK